ncbi:MAG TPA: SoxR reducing system RseC family protein [Firmicutes bacterium]|nr:SoxR reducing system RseC family protein [Candidatus Fermentithermobacillaceae bacterium]
MKEFGRVTGVSGGKITVAVKRTAACERCQQCRHAHIGFGENEMLIVEAVPVGDVKPGDLVELEMTGRDYLRLSFLVYVLPLLAAGAGLGIGYLLGRAMGNPGLWGGVFAIIGMAGSFLWLNQYDKAAARTGRYLPLARPVREED